jgi:hypothetical protein
MKVICTGDAGSKLSRNHFDVGYSASSKFHISVETEYVVYGIALWRGLLSYLVVDNNSNPGWYPADLFRVLDATVPAMWYFAFFGQTAEQWLNAVWGYEELKEPNHYDDLTNLKEEAVRIFQERRKELE